MCQLRTRRSVLAVAISSIVALSTCVTIASSGLSIVASVGSPYTGGAYHNVNQM